MKYKEISNRRLFNQHIEGAEYSNIKELVSALGAVQAQDPNMVKWALGVRLPGSTIKDVDRAISCGDIIRTHLLRPTWHIAAVEDVYWMLQLTAAKIRRSAGSRHKELGLTPDVLKKSRKVIEKALAKEGYLIREKLVKALEEAKINTKENRASHIFFDAELECLICSGPLDGNKYTYALFDERITQKKNFSKTEALAELAGRYFSTRGPAAVNDFAWWSGLNLTEAKKAAEMLDDNFIREKIGGEIYIYRESNSSAAGKKKAFLLPAYDELIICYKDRNPTIQADHHKKAVSSNGLFRPIVVIDGKVEGIWKPVKDKDDIKIEINMFDAAGTGKKKIIKEASTDYGRFLGMKTEVDYIK